MSFGLESVNAQSKNKIDENGVVIQRENEKFVIMCSRPPHDLKFDHFTS